MSMEDAYLVDWFNSFACTVGLHDPCLYCLQARNDVPVAEGKNKENPTSGDVKTLSARQYLEQIVTPILLQVSSPK